MKTYSTFIWANGVIKLYTPRTICADIACIIFPTHPEDDDSVRFRHPLQNLCISINSVVENEWNESFNNFMDSLMKLRLSWISLSEALHEMI